MTRLIECGRFSRLGSSHFWEDYVPAGTSVERACEADTRGPYHHVRRYRVASGTHVLRAHDYDGVPSDPVTIPPGYVACSFA